MTDTIKKLAVGSRESKLAVVQSMLLVDYLKNALPETDIELVTMKTTGDKILDRTLDKVGGKGLFVKELDNALMDGRVDLTVHSLKDVPMQLPDGLPLLCFPPREDPRDVLVLPEGVTELKQGAVIGSSSLRRVLQLKNLFPGCEFKPVRGNLQTRLRKLDDGEVDALVLAAAGMKRMGLANRVSRYFTVDEMIPAAGQGILAVQGRAGEAYPCLAGLDNAEARDCALAERAFVRELDGGCTSPICAHAHIEGETLTLKGLYWNEETREYTVDTAKGPRTRAEALGIALARKLRDGKENAMAKGKVWLVGAGPGDAGLFTLKGRTVLQNADVVVYDALVGEGVLALIPDTARLIFAGKRSGNHYLRQEETNRVLLEEALKGNRVVRLKGGDPFVFGRGGEELELLVENDIPFEIVPGVTSAFAVPAYNGIPVTHRDLCSSVHIITGHRRGDSAAGIDFDALVRTEGTLVFLMGIAALGDICRGLLNAGKDPETPAAVLERGTTAAQGRVSATLGTLEAVCAKREIRTPAIIAVGGVCGLADTFGWAEKRPLGGVRVIVTRPRELSSALAEMLREKGAEVLELPAIRTEAIPDNEALNESISALSDGAYDWAVFTSPTGVEVFMKALFASSDIRALAGVKLAAIGTGTAKALAKYGLRTDFIPSVYDAETLGRELAAYCEPNDCLFIPRAAMGNPELTRALAERTDLTVTEVATYDTVYTAPAAVDTGRALESGAPTLAVFTSASTVRGFAAVVPEEALAGVNAVCIGKQTKAAALSFGMNACMAEKATLEALVKRTEEAADALRAGLPMEDRT